MSGKRRLTWSASVTKAALVFFLSGCSSSRTQFTSTWAAANAQPVSAAGMQIAAVVISPSESMRRIGETALASEITRFGGIGITSYKILPGDPKNRDAARRQLKAAGIDAVISMRVISHDQVVSYTPGYWTGSPWHSSLWGYWGYGWGSVYAPGYLETETLVGVETLLYSLDDDKLLWAGVSETFNPKDVQSAVRKIAKKAVDKMHEENVLMK
jgi:hypothetical protein